MSRTFRFWIFYAGWALAVGLVFDHGFWWTLGMDLAGVAMFYGAVRES